ncbi:MAG: transcriptional regulator PpsR [Beijerinckiaceae bacterium]
MKNTERNHALSGGMGDSGTQSPFLPDLGLADVAFLINGKGRIQAARFAASSSLASALSGAEGLMLSEVVATDSRDKAAGLLLARDGGVRELNFRLSSSREPLPLRCALSRQDGALILYCADIRPLAEAQQRLIEAQQTLERDYARMRAAETRYRALFQLSREPMLIVDAQNRRVIEANAACLGAFNLPLARIAGRSIAALFDEHDGDSVAALLTSAMASGHAGGAVLRAAASENRFDTSADILRLDGATFLLVRPSPRHADAATAPGVVQSVIDQWPDAFAVVDSEGVIIDVNQAFIDLGEAPARAGIIGQRLDRWLGREGLDKGLLLAALKDFGVVRGFATVFRGQYGAAETVEVSAARVAHREEARAGVLIRVVREAGPKPAVIGAGLNATIEQMKDLVGKVPLKELVRETTDVIERLCIEAALDMTNDNRASAAELLGLSRQSLYAKLHRFGLGDLSGPDEA